MVVQLGQPELMVIAIVASLTLSACYFAGRYSGPRMPVAAPAPIRSRVDAPAPAPVTISRPTISAPRAITQWLSPAEIAVLYVAEWRKGGHTFQARLTLDLDRDIRNFCETYGIALVCAQEVRSALYLLPGVDSRREILKTSNPRHQEAIERARVLGLKSGRYIVWYCSRKAPKIGTSGAAFYTLDDAGHDSDGRGAVAAKARGTTATARSRSTARQAPVTRPKHQDQGELLVGHEVRRAA